jgi:hypothetical protein
MAKVKLRTADFGGTRSEWPRIEAACGALSWQSLVSNYSIRDDIRDPTSAERRTLLSVP